MNSKIGLEGEKSIKHGTENKRVGSKARNNPKRVKGEGKIRGIGLILVLLFLFASLQACGVVQINPEKDRLQVVAEVGGEKILKGELLDELDRTKESYNLTDEAIRDKNNEEDILNIKKSILDQLALEKLLKQKAKDAGFIVTPQLEDEAREDLKSIKEEIKTQIEESDKALGDQGEDEEGQGSGEKDYAKEAEDYFNEYLLINGMDEEAYIISLAEQRCVEKLYDKTVGGIELADADIEEFYSKELDAQRENVPFISTRPVTLFSPHQIRVKHILMEIPREKATEYENLIKDGKEDDAKELLDKELNLIKAKSENVLKSAKIEEDFDELARSFNPDNQKEMETGLLINKEDLYLPEEYKEVAFSLKEGEISDLVATPHGYYIIKAGENLPEKTFTLDEKRDEIRELLLKERKDDKWMEVVEEWKDKLIKKFEKRL